MPYDRLASLTLHQLRTFRMVVQTGSFAAAAEALGISQPAVSESVRSLETLLGVRALERFPGRRRVELTLAGRILLRACEEVERALVEADSDLSALRGHTSGLLAFGAEPCFGGYVLPAVYASFRRAYPGITVRPVIDVSANIVERLRRRELDLAVVVGPVTHAGVVSEIIGGYDVVLVGWPGHRLAGRAPAPFAELVHEHLFLTDTTTPIRQALDRVAAQAGVRLTPSMEVNHIEIKIQAIRAGLGIAPLPTYSVEREVSEGRLSVLHVQGFPLWIPWALVHPVGALRPSVSLFQQHVRRWLLIAQQARSAG